MHGPQGHVGLSPVILEELEGRRYPGVAKGEVFLAVGIECGAMPEAVYVTILGSHGPIDFGMVNHMLLVDGRRPGEYKQVVAFARRNLSRRERVDFFHRAVVDHYFGIVLLA